MDGLFEHSDYRLKQILKVATVLARAFLAGESTPVSMRARGAVAIGQAAPWLAPLALAVRYEFANDLKPQIHDSLVKYILSYPAFQKAFEPTEAAPEVRGYFPYHTEMEPIYGRLSALRLPQLPTPGDLADWLEIPFPLLDWFANVPARTRSSGQSRLAHYNYRWMPKRQGGARLIEAPKTKLRDIQRRILCGILNQIPVHAAAQGCVRGRSVIGNASLHVGSPLILKLDLRDFFVSVPGSRIHALFRSIGYPLATTRYLTALTTHRTPVYILQGMPEQEYASHEQLHRNHLWARRFMNGHLPQGAPTSPALANLCAYHMDLRLTGAALTCGAAYSRYVDDMVFSCAEGDAARALRMLKMFQEIILEEGFEPNWRKTRRIPAFASQRVTGVVVNTRLNPPRRDFDALKAILTNCQRHGPDSQNRQGLPNFREHLQGRITWIQQLNPEKGRKLQEHFDSIIWR
jgi:RNA-directed DNA polymerase